jgi:hypothetical protein
MFVDSLLYTVDAYVVIGLAFALPFVSRGVNRLDPAAGSSGWGFRAVILPGVIALWPLLLAKWWRHRR